jgi:hypothetical protein
MPIIQHLIASRLRVDTAMVQAGIYTLENETHEWHTYSAADIRLALTRARQLGAQIVVAARQLHYRL